MLRGLLMATVALVACGLEAPRSAPRVGGALAPLASPCSISSGVVSVSLAANEVAVVGLDDAGVLLVNGQACSTATNLTTTRITVSTANQQMMSDESVTFDVSRGLFALGTASLPGITVSLGAGSNDEVRVDGSSSDDVWLAGRSTTDEWLTLNYDRFKDVSMTGVESVALSGAGGNDVLNGSAANPAWATGTYFTTSLPSTLALTLNGGDGADTLTGGAGNDSLLGGNGDDVLVESAGTDSANGQARC